MGLRWRVLMSAKMPSKKVSATAATEGAKSVKARILVVDDHPIVREGLVRVIDQSTDLLVCAHAENIQQALEAVESSKPDLVIVDISLGGQNGIELIKDIKVRHPGLPVLVHSMYDEAMYAERCLRVGAKGYVMKQEPPHRLLDGARRVLKGEVHLSETMTKQLLCRISSGPAGKGGSPSELLSDREFEVFELLGRGHRTREIAQLLHLSDKTIQTYREHIKEKLNIDDAVGLVRQAVQWVEAQR
jgi:DNA-binding NarL/FixJ family response regulator